MRVRLAAVVVVLALAMEVSPVAAVTPPSAPQNAIVRSWLSGVTAGNLNLLATQGDATATQRFFDLPPAYVTAGFGQPYNIPSSWTTPPSLAQTWTSEAQFESDVTSQQVNPGVVWALYDPEVWSGTPTNEQQDPATYEMQFCNFAHANGFKCMTEPSPNLVQLQPGYNANLTVTVGGGMGTVHDYYSQFISMNFPCFSARYADRFGLQFQVLETDTTLFANDVQSAMAQAQSCQASILMEEDLSTCPTNNISGSPLQVTSAQEYAASEVGQPYLNGFRQNMPTNTTCTQTQQVSVATGFLQDLTSAQSKVMSVVDAALSWSASAPGSNPVSSYEVWRGGCAGCESLWSTVNAPSSSTVTFYDCVANNSTAYYKVRAVATDGSVSGFSTEISIASQAGISCSAAGSGPRLVQKGSVVTGPAGTAITVTLPAASTAGDLLVATLSIGSGTNGTYSFTGPAGWVKAVSVNSSNQDAEVWYYPNNPGGITSAIFTPSGGYPRGELSEWAGVASTTPLDVTGTSTAAGATSSTVATSVNTTFSNDLAITAWAFDPGSPTTVTFTPGSGWTELGSTGSLGIRYNAAYDYQSGVSGLVSETETASVAGSWAAVVATFHP